MPLCQDIEKIETLLQNFNKKLEPESDKQLKEDIETLLNVLNCSVFDCIVKVKQSLNELNEELIKHPSILPLDFDISSSTGDLLLNISLENNQINANNSDSFEPNSDPEPNFDFECDVPDKAVQDKFNNNQVESKEPFYVNIPSKASQGETELVSGLDQNDISEELLAAFSKLPNPRELKHIRLMKPEGSILGFSVIGLKSDTRGDLGIFIEDIAIDGVAGRDGQLQEGDQILAIDGHVFNTSIPHEEAIDILQKAHGIIDIFVARRTVPDEKSDLKSIKEKKSDLVVIETEGEEDKSSNQDMVLNTEWAQVEMVEIVNDGTGLGFGIIGGKSSGVVVKTIVPGGVSDLDGRLRSGDHILQINDVNLRGMSSEQVAQVLRMAGSEVKLVVARPIEASQVETIKNNQSIVPTRLLSDPEVLERHLMHSQQKQHAEPDASQSGTASNNMDGLKALVKLASQSDSTQSSKKNELILTSESPEMKTFEVELIKDRQGLGITIAGYVCEKEEISGIFVKSIAKDSSADKCQKIAINDQIIEVDGRSLYGYSNQEAVDVLRNTGKVVRLRLARYHKGTKYELLQQAFTNADVNPATVIQKLGKTTVIQVQSDSKAKDESVIDQDHIDFTMLSTKEELLEKWQNRMGPDYEIIFAQINKFKEEGGLGISLEGTVDLDQDGREVRPHHYIKAILPAGPVGMNGSIQSGDEILEVNGKELLDLNHEDVIHLLKELPLNVCMVCSRPVSNSMASREDSSSANYNNFSTVNGNSHSPEEFSSFISTGDRLVKAKSDGSLAIGSSVSMDLSRMKSRSLEPLTGLVMWSNEVQVIDLIKSERGLGFSILDYQDPMNSNETVIVIRSLVPGGIAQKDGRLIPGDRLLFVNDISLENSNLDMAVQALKGAPRGIVRIGVAKPLPLPETSSFQQSHSSQELPFFITKDQQLISNSNSNSLIAPKQASNGTAQHPVAEEKHFEKTKCPEVTTAYSKNSFPETHMTPKLVHAPAFDEEIILNDQQSPTLVDYQSSPFDAQSSPAFTSSPSSLEKTIKISKGTTPLGLTLEVIDKCMIVKDIPENGAIFKDGRIQIGDCLIAINNENLKDITNSQARVILRRAQLLSTDITIRYVPACEVEALKLFDSLAMQKASRGRESPLLSFLRRSPSPRSPYFGPNNPDDRQSSYSLNQVLDMKNAEAAEISKKAVRHTLSLRSLPTDLIPLSDSDFETSKSTQSTSSQPDKDTIIDTICKNDYEQGLETEPTHVTKVDIVPDTDQSSAQNVPEQSSPMIQPIISENLCSTTPIVVGSSTASCHWDSPRNIELVREPNQGLGISIVGGKVDMFNLTPGHFVGGIFVKNVSPGSVAARNGALKRGDRILEVDGKDLRDATHDQAVEAIRNAQNPIKMVVQSLMSLVNNRDENHF